MMLGWNEIRSRALKFSNEWKDEERETAERQTFWNEFFDVFGISRRRVATFEEGVKKLTGAHGSIDLFWPGRLLVEHKSAWKDLDDAYDQAIGYTANLSEKEMPEYIVVSDFKHFRLYNLNASVEDRMQEFELKDLSKKVRLFGFMLGFQEVILKKEDPVNKKAVKAVANLHDALKESGYVGHELEVLLVRLVYCFFADDTGIFDEVDTFRSYLEYRTNKDGSDTGAILIKIFDVLNTEISKRQKALPEELAKLPYVDGPLFQERISSPDFDAEMRETLLDCASFDWGKVSPVIFGSMFQQVMDQKLRDQLGAHYTSETNIFKVIEPLFLDELRRNLSEAGTSKQKLQAFIDKLRTLKFLDPACGCGNFLVVTYRELRKLELTALERLHPRDEKGLRQTAMLQNFRLSQVNVDQFYGIEIEEFASRIAELALWLTDHQMNMELSDSFGVAFKRLPLSTHPNIHQKNALRTDWNEIVPKTELSYILGNPPFQGSRVMSEEQKQDMHLVFEGVRELGFLDFVTAWYMKAARYIQDTKVSVAFVSTNSITQGEQVGILWDELYGLGMNICFAHKTFRWSNEASGKAAVYCVIIGFSQGDCTRKTLFEYEDIAGEPHAIVVKNINPYLVDAPNLIVRNRQKPICNVPEMSFGSMPRDAGHLILNDEERVELLRREPAAKQFVREFIGAQEFLHNENRYCLWLDGIEPSVLRKLPLVMDRVQRVKEFRLASKAVSTRKMAETPYLFAQRTQPESDYLLIPRVSSERRNYIPIGFNSRERIAADSCMTVGGATLYHFGVLMSTMHMSWVRQICGRLKSDYRYSKDIVYNNFPWPKDPNAKLVAKVEECAQAVLDARKNHPSSTLADLYNPSTMPKDLHDAHVKLDRAVDACYGKKLFKSEMERLELLFEMYREYLSIDKSE